MKHTSSRGFTLIELMITVAIIGVLAAVAYPAYTSSIIKGKRAQGRTALAELLQQQERYMTQRNTYLAFTTSSSFVTTPASVPFKVFSGDNTSNAAYAVYADNCPSGTGTFSIQECVRVNAAPVKSDPEVGTLWMLSTGGKGCTGTAATSSPTTCWP